MKPGDLVQPTAAAAGAFPELLAADRAVVLKPRAGQRSWQLRLQFLDGRTVRCWDQAWWKRSTDLLLTDEHRSMIASAFVGAFDHKLGVVECKRRSLCCAHDTINACARIVGKRKAEALRTFFYENLGCSGWSDPEYQETQEQYFLDKIATLEKL